MSSKPDDMPAPDDSKQPEQSTASATATSERAAVHSAATELTDEEVAARHRAWMAEHGKTYSDEGEKERRIGIFRDNLRYIEAHNRGGHSYTLGLNQFADLTTEEFRTTYCGGFLEPTPAEAHRPPSDDTDAAPDQEEDEGNKEGDGRSPPPQAQQDL